MSTSEMQRALVGFIKNPDLNRGDDVESYLEKFSFNESEKWQVRGLAGNLSIAKFGRDLREKRYGFAILKNLNVTKHLVDQNRFREFLFREFEPDHARVPEKKLFTAFIKFLAANSGKAREYGVSELALDMIRYEYAEFFINADDAYKAEWQIPEDSLLVADCPFRIERFSYDVLSLIEGESCVTKHADFEAFRKPTTILFFKQTTNEEEEEHVTEQFEIDASVAQFLESLLSGEIPAEFPPFYSELVSIGLVKDRKHA